MFNNLIGKNKELGRFLFCERYTLPPVKNAMYIAEGQELKKGAVVDVNGYLIGTAGLQPYAVLEFDCDTRDGGKEASVFLMGEFNYDKLSFADGLSKDDMDNIVYNARKVGIVIKPYSFSLGFVPQAEDEPENFEKAKKYAKVGDAIYADSLGNVHVIEGKSVKASTIPEGWEFVGVVSIRESGKAKVLYKTAYQTAFINLWTFKLSGLKLDGTDELTLRQASNSDDSTIEVGTFTASEAATDLDTFTSELDTWLRDNTTVAGAVPNYNWHAEKIKDAEGNDCCFIVVDNLTSKTRVSPVKSSSSGATCTAYIFEFSGIDTSENNPVRKDGIKTMYCLWNVDYFKYVNTSIGSPSDTLQANGVYNEAGFNATTFLKSYYGTYDSYLEDMMVDVNATDGIMPVYKGTGKSVTAKLDDVVVNKLDGTQINLFKSAHYATALKAHSSASVTGLNLGDWYIAAIDEKSEILGQMMYNGSDVINTTLIKAGQIKFDLSAVVWAPAKYLATDSVTFANQSRFNSNWFGNLYYRDFYVAEIDL